MPILVYEKGNLINYLREESAGGCKASLVIEFSISVTQADIKGAGRLLLKCVGMETLEVYFYGTVFESDDCVSEAIALLERFRVTNIRFGVLGFSVTEFDSIFAYCGRAKVCELMFVSMGDRWVDVFIKHLPKMSLEALMISCGTTGNDMLKIWDNLCASLERLIVHNLRVFGSCSITKRHDSLRDVSISILPREWAMFASLVLSHCKSLSTLMVQYDILTSTTTLDGDTYRAILSHPSLDSISVEGVSFGSQMGVEKAVKNRKKCRAMMAFLNKRVERVATKCVMRRLFRDADGLIWSFLV